MRLRKPDVPRKPYKSPVLIVHGTVTDLTRAVGQHGMKDGGIRGRIKTTV